MPGSGSLRQKLHHLSRDRRILLRVSLAILGVSFLAAMATSAARRILTVEAEPRSPLISLELSITRENATPQSIAQELRNLHHLIDGRTVDDSLETDPSALPQGLNLTTLEDFLARCHLDASQRQLFIAYLNARYADDELRDEGRLHLETHAGMTPPIRFANEFLGDLAYLANEIEESIVFYERETSYYNSVYARERLLHLALLTDNTGKLRTLAVDPEFREVATRSERIELAIVLEDWTRLLAEVIAYEIHSTSASEFFLSAFAASIWFVIVIQMARFTRKRLALFIGGIVAGIASATLTLYVLILQENFGGMKPGGSWVEEIIFYVVGVGLREEFLKLAAFTPLILFLRKDRDTLGAFLTASCVGLGFALQENISHYAEHGDIAAVGRFVSANFLHLAWTGLLGHSLFGMVLSPKHRWEEFLASFLAIVLVHGLYDSLLAIPEFSDYSVLSFVIIFFVAQQYFHRAATLRDARPHAVAPLAVFLLGTTLLIGVVLNYVTWQIGLFDSLRIVASVVLSICLVAFVFVNEFKTQ